MTVDTYLSILSKELRGLVSEDEREALVCEQRSWLEGRLRDEIVCGLPYSEAEAKVVMRNGKPHALAQRMAFEAYEDEVNTPIYNLLGRAHVNANSVFGLMGGLYMCFLYTRIYLPTGQAMAAWKSPGELRAILPASMFDPELTWQFFVTLGFPLVAPLVAGWICGRLIPVGAARAVYHVVVLMTLACFLMSLLLLPDRTALIFAALLAFYWLPVGCLVTHLSSSFSLWLRRRRLERPGWSPSSPGSMKEESSL